MSSIIKKLKVLAKVTKIENGKLFYDVGGLFQASDDLQECFIKPEIGEVLLYTVTLETLTTSDQAIRRWES